MMVLILSSLSILHSLIYTISIGSNIILYKTLSLLVFQILCGFAFCMYQFNFALLLEPFVSAFKLLSCFALFFLERHTLLHFHNKTLYTWYHCHWTRGTIVRPWEFMFEVLNPQTHSQILVGHSSHIIRY